MSVRMTDFDHAETHLLNAQLDARRRTMRGEFTDDELATLQAHLDAALAHTRALALALLPTTAPAVAARGRR